MLYYPVRKKRKDAEAPIRPPIPSTREKDVLKTSLKNALFFLLFFIISPGLLPAKDISFVKEFTYRRGLVDTKETSRIAGLARAGRLIREEIAGRLEIKGRMIPFLSGIILPELISERWDGKVYRCRFQIKINDDDLKRFFAVTLRERGKAEEIEEIAANYHELMGELAGIRKKAVTPEKAEEMQVWYISVSEQLAAEEFMGRGYALRNNGRYGEAVTAFSEAIKFLEKPIIVKKRTPIAKVTAQAARLRSRPYLSASAVSVARKGDMLPIIAEREDRVGRSWCKVSLGDDKFAWIIRSTVTIIQQEEEIKAPGNGGVWPRVRALVGRGGSYGSSGDTEKALADLDAALALDPQFTRAFNSKGVVYMDSGEMGKAINEFFRAVKIDPEGATAYINRGFAYTEIEEYGKAREDLDKAISLEPENEFAYSNRGRLNVRSGNFQDAIHDFSRAMEINPLLAVAFTGRGVTYAVLKDYEKALIDLDRSVALDPKGADAYYSRGTVYMNKGESSRAFEDYKIAAGLGDMEARKYLESKDISWEE